MKLIEHKLSKQNGSCFAQIMCINMCMGRKTTISKCCDKSMGDINFFFILFYIFQILYKGIIIFIRKKLKYVHTVESLLKYVLLFAISEVTAVVNF